MTIETKMMTDKKVTMQLKVITDELYELMWELQPTAETLQRIKDKLLLLTDGAWQDYATQAGKTVVKNNINI